MKLAAHLGMTLRELHSRMDSAEVAEWMAYDDIEPLADSWRQTGLLAALMVNLWTKGERRSPEDFVPRARPATEATSSEADLARFRAFVAIAEARQQRGA